MTTPVDDFLTSAATGPSALVIEGEAGIGKTTLWLSAMDEARERGFRVMSARAIAAESVLAYASLADLLDGVSPSAWANLPEPQRLAVVRLVHAETDGPSSDQRALAAGFLAIVDSLAESGPVLLALDDAQWLDPSSISVIAYVARRLKERIGVLATVRLEPLNQNAVHWLQMPRPNDLRRLHVPPLSMGGLQLVISERLGRSFARPTMARIHEISGATPSMHSSWLGRSKGTQTTAMCSCLDRWPIWCRRGSNC